MLRYEFTEPFFTNTPYSGKSCQGHITNRMTTWYLRQIREDLSLSVMIAEGYINNAIHDGTLPKSLVGLPPDRPPIHECELFILTLRLFGQYITTFKEKSNSVEELRLSLEAVVDTKVKVVDHEVMMFSDDIDLIDFVRAKVIEAGYLFRTTMVKEEAEKWWEPLTKDR